MAGRGPGERNLEAGIRLILEELRDMRFELRADRRRSDEERRQADEERRRADEERRQERVRSDARFEKVMRETQQAFKDVRSVGLSIVKTLNHHTRILERIERRLGAHARWRPGHGNGRGGSVQR